MRDLHRANAEQTAVTQRTLGALIREVTALLEGAQVLRSAFAPASPLSATDASAAGGTETGGTETEAAPASPSGVPPEVGAPPAPEHSDGLGDCRAPATLPSAGSPSGSEHITTYVFLWNRVHVSSDGGWRHRQPSRSLSPTVRRLPTPSAHATAPAVSLLAGWLAVLLPATSPSSTTQAGAACVHFLAPACLQRWHSFLLWGVSFLPPPPPTACAARPAGVAFKQLQSSCHQ